jgi:hypothetical protein
LLQSATNAFLQDSGSVPASEVDAAVAVPASGDDVFHCFVLPTNLPEDKHVVAVEVRPGNPKVLHHVLNFIDVSGAGKKLDAADPGPGYKTDPGGVGFFPGYTYYAPPYQRGFHKPHRGKWPTATPTRPNWQIPPPLIPLPTTQLIRARRLG